MTCEASDAISRLRPTSKTPPLEQARKGLVFVALLSIASLSGCAPDEEVVPVTVVLTSGSQLAHAPSSLIVRIASTDTGEEVTATATQAVTVEDEGLVLLEDELQPGQYRVEAAQLSCGMRGGDCPEDPSSSEFDTAPDWHCSASLEVSTGRPARVQIVEGPDPDVADQKLCRVIG